MDNLISLLKDEAQIKSEILDILYSNERQSDFKKNVYYNPDFSLINLINNFSIEDIVDILKYKTFDIFDSIDNKTIYSNMSEFTLLHYLIYNFGIIKFYSDKSKSDEFNGYIAGNTEGYYIIFLDNSLISLLKDDVVVTKRDTTPPFFFVEIDSGLKEKLIKQMNNKDK